MTDPYYIETMNAAELRTCPMCGKQMDHYEYECEICLDCQILVEEN